MGRFEGSGGGDLLVEGVAVELLVFDSVEVLAVDIGERGAPFEAWVMNRSRTAKTSERQLVSPGKRPITLVRRRTSPSERSSRFVERHRSRCLSG